MAEQAALAKKQSIEKQSVADLERTLSVGKDLSSETKQAEKTYRLVGFSNEERSKVTGLVDSGKDIAARAQPQSEKRSKMNRLASRISAVAARKPKPKKVVPVDSANSSKRFKKARKAASKVSRKVKTMFSRKAAKK